jgi:uncharacterized membrane protein YqjE
LSASPGLFASARSLLGAVLDLGQTRLQLAAVEVEEERARIAELLLWATCALFFIGLGIVFTSLLVVLLCWNGPREWVLGGFAALFAGLGGWAAATWRHKLRTKPAFLAATLAELERDRAAFVPPPAP